MPYGDAAFGLRDKLGIGISAHPQGGLGHPKGYCKGMGPREKAIHELYSGHLMVGFPRVRLQ